MSKLQKIVSGGQTGVDRGALDAALDHDFPCGGWCPEGRHAEDGALPPRYPLRALPGGDHRQRTTRNVADSDGTAILHFGELTGGTRHTREDCTARRKPCVLLDGDVLTAAGACRRLRAFIDEHGIGRLNVAGPRASEAADGYAFAHAVISRLLAGRFDDPKC